MNELILEASKVVQSVLMASPNGVLVLQPIFSIGGVRLDLFLTAVNTVARQELDRPVNEVLGQSLSTYFPHLAGTESLDKYWQVIGTKKPARFQTMGTQPGQIGSRRFDISAVPLEHNLLITYSEITSLHPDNSPEPWINILQQAFDESVSGLSVFEALLNEQGQPRDFRLVRINKAGLMLIGSRRKEIVGKSLWEIYPATGINDLFDQCVNVWKTGRVFTSEQYYPDKNLWRDVTIVRLDRGVLVTYTDTTALRKKEEKARLRTQLFGELLEDIPVGMSILRPIDPVPDVNSVPHDFRLVQANSPMCKLTGLPPDHIIGQLVSQLFSKTNADDLLESCRIALEKATVQVIDLLINDDDGSSRYQASVAPKGDLLIAVFTRIQSR